MSKNAIKPVPDTSANKVQRMDWDGENLGLYLEIQLRSLKDAERLAVAHDEVRRMCREMITETEPAPPSSAHTQRLKAA